MKVTLMKVYTYHIYCKHVQTPTKVTYNKIFMDMISHLKKFNLNLIYHVVIHSEEDIEIFVSLR